MKRNKDSKTIFAVRIGKDGARTFRQLMQLVMLLLGGASILGLLAVAQYMMCVYDNPSLTIRECLFHAK